MFIAGNHIIKSHMAAYIHKASFLHSKNSVYIDNFQKR